MNRKVIGVFIAIIAVAAIIFVVVAAQKDDTKSSSDSSNSSSHNGTSHESSNKDNTDTGDTAEATNTVAIENFDYSPQKITVKKGTTVTWTNNDSVEHTVTKEGDTGPDSELFGKGETYSYTFDEVGTFDYYCAPHPNMKGQVVVTE